MRWKCVLTGMILGFVLFVLTYLETLLMTSLWYFLFLVSTPNRTFKGSLQFFYTDRIIEVKRLKSLLSLVSVCI